MRCVAGVGLIVLAGCNQIFGLAPARTWDAAIDVPPDMPRVMFTWQLATSQPSGVPAAALEYPAFAPSFTPAIRIAPLDGPLAPADYLTTPEMPGWVLIPRSYLGTTWRLEYTFPNGVPHEVQWAPEDKLGHLVVPMVGRLDRASAPGGGGYTITPSNYSGGYTFPRVFTTGLWTDGPVIPPGTGSTIDYDFSSAMSLSGPKGNPVTAKGDRGLLVDFITDSATGCRVAVGSALLDPTLSDMHTPQTVTWDTGRKTLAAPMIDTIFLERVTTDPLHGDFQTGRLSTLLYGAVASTDFPGLIGTPPPLSSISLAIPLMHTLLRCPYNTSVLPDTASPALLDDFPRVLHMQLVVSRPVPALSVNLTGGLETVVASSAAGGFKLAFPAPFATQIKLATPAAGTLDLSGPADELAAGSPTGSFTLTFVPETGPGLRADYHDVVLHRIVGGSLTTERIFTVTAARVQIDGALLVPGADYVFEIRTYKGHPMAESGDFVPVDYPYGAAIVFSRTFKTS
jgi:hypothetical protein